MEARFKAKKISIYINEKKKSISQIQAETGCDYIINGGLFLWSWKACPWLKAGGKVYSQEADWSAWGYSWNTAEDFCMSHDRDKANYISCVDLINPWDGPVKKPIYNADVGGKRGRTAIGQMPDGTILLYVGSDSAGAKTPEQLRDWYSEKGAKTALMLDGGGSSQCIFPTGRVSSSRIVHNLLCFWEEKDERENTEGTEKENGALGNLRKGDKGELVKALQSRLNQLGYSLTVDGDFGSATYNAVKDFQDNTALTADGIVGPATEAMLSRVAAYKGSTNALVRRAASYIGLKEPNGDDRIIRAYNELTGAGFPMTVSWCQMFTVVCQEEAGMTPYLTASCTTARNYYRSKNLWGSEPAVGKLIYFDWDKSGDCDHVGIVAGIEGDRVYTIEGNASGAGKDGVRVKNYAKSSRQIAGYADLSAAEAQPQGKTGLDKAKEKGWLDGIEVTGMPTWGDICEVLSRAGLLQ